MYFPDVIPFLFFMLYYYHKKVSDTVDYAKLKDYPFNRVAFNWIVCIKGKNGKSFMKGYKWDVINGIYNFKLRDKLLDSNILKVDIKLDIVAIQTDFEF